MTSVLGASISTGLGAVTVTPPHVVVGQASGSARSNPFVYGGAGAPTILGGPGATPSQSTSLGTLPAAGGTGSGSGSTLGGSDGSAPGGSTPGGSTGIIASISGALGSASTSLNWGHVGLLLLLLAALYLFGPRLWAATKGTRKGAVRAVRGK